MLSDMTLAFSMTFFGFLLSGVAVREARKELGGADWTELVNASMNLRMVFGLGGVVCLVGLMVFLFTILPI